MPATGIKISLEQRNGDVWLPIGKGVTDSDGRVADLLTAGSLQRTQYRISFVTEEYFSRQGVQGFYPVVRIEFQITEIDQHYHVPLLLSRFGYSTYRGS